MRRAVIEIECDENALLKGSLTPETSRTIPRTSVSITEKGEVLSIDIVASDVNALRAAINSYLRWVTVGMETAALSEGR